GGRFTRSSRGARASFLALLVRRRNRRPRPLPDRRDVSTAPRTPPPGPAPAGSAPSVLEATRAADARPALPAPRALLLDFGGVVISTTSRLSWARELAEIVVERARAVGAELETAEVEESLRVGRSALSLWKNAASRRLAPRELAPREIVE